MPARRTSHSTRPVESGQPQARILSRRPFYSVRKGLGAGNDYYMIENEIDFCSPHNNEGSSAAEVGRRERGIRMAKGAPVHDRPITSKSRELRQASVLGLVVKQQHLNWVAVVDRCGWHVPDVPVQMFTFLPTSSIRVPMYYTV